MSRESDLTPYSVFLDESSQTKHRYLTIGCLVMEKVWVPQFELVVKHAKRLDLPAGELKWSKVSRAKLFGYKLAVDKFFDHSMGKSPLQFHTLVVDTSKRNEKLYNNGSKELGFNKEVYQLLMACARRYKNASFDVTPDHRNTSYSTEELRQILNHGCRKNGDKRDSPFKRVSFRDSKDVLSLQLTDILLGAATFQINGHHLKPDASETKKHLSDYILDRSGIRDPMRDIYRGKFTIWHRKLKPAVPQGQGS